ncbi:MAG TPA: hypothetical protein VM912_23435 [Terriglobales bacterium]|nr:hypothetical protein [Terriglobales bacterium]
MSLFRSADSISLVYSNVELAKQWWINAFDCQPVPLPEEWDNPLRSDVALKFRGEHAAMVLLSDKSERDEPMPTVPIIFSDRVQKAHEYLRNRGVLPGLYSRVEKQPILRFTILNLIS